MPDEITQYFLCGACCLQYFTAEEAAACDHNVPEVYDDGQ